MAVERAKRAKVEVYFLAFFSSAHRNMFQPFRVSRLLQIGRHWAKYSKMAPVYSSTSSLYIIVIYPLNGTGIHSYLNRNNPTVEHLESGSEDSHHLPSLWIKGGEISTKA